MSYKQTAFGIRLERLLELDRQSGLHSGLAETLAQPRQAQGQGPDQRQPHIRRVLQLRLRQLVPLERAGGLLDVGRLVPQIVDRRLPPEATDGKQLLRRGGGGEEEEEGVQGNHQRSGEKVQYKNLLLSRV